MKIKEKIQNYLMEVRQEMEKVSWPTWIEARSTTWIVIIMSLILAVFLFGADQLLSNIAKLIL
ncbi:MAG: preprotein translocase subunit SecE [bacterium]|nr:preprotein translocase subunit SecE [bacterium]